MPLPQNNRSIVEQPSLPPTEHEISPSSLSHDHVSPHETSRHEPRLAGILVKSPRVYTRHIRWENQLQTRQTTSAVESESPCPTAPNTPCRLQRGRSSKRGHPVRSRPPSPYPWPAGQPSPETSPARSTGRHIQFGSLPSPDRDGNRHGNLRRRAPSPYPGKRGKRVTRSDKEQNDSHDGDTSEKKARKSFWQHGHDIEASFLALSVTADGMKPRNDSEGDSYDREKD